MPEEKKGKIVILDIIGFDTYRCEFPNDEILDYLNLTREDILDVDFSFVDMSGHFYREDISFLGNVTVGGGSIGIEIVSSIGVFELQPFLRYDKRHKSGLQVEHFNPQLRIIYPNGRIAILPEKGTKYNIFGKNMPEVLRIKSNIHLWEAYDPENPNNKLKGKIVKKLKRKSPTTKRMLKVQRHDSTENQLR